MPQTATTLKRIIQGGATFMAGSLGGMALQFIIGILIIRIVSPGDYGRISLGYIIVNMASMISTLGMSNGLPRFIAMYAHTPNPQYLSRILGNALLLVIAMSIGMTVVLYILSDNMALIYNKPKLEVLLYIFMLMIPPIAVILVLNGIFRGLERALPQAIFNDGLLSVSRLALLIGVILLGLGYESVLGVYVLSTWITFVAYLAFALKTVPALRRPRFHTPLAFDMVRFSLPLLGVGIMANIMNWAGTLVLGYYGSNQDVGLFNAPLRLTTIIAAPLAAVVFLYLPVATRLIETHAHKELEELYVSATKWSFLLSFPLTLYILVDAEFIVTRLFGDGYRGAADLLRILTLGTSLNTFAGPNGMTLIAHGDTRTVLHSTLLAGLFTIGLSMLLVPRYGVVGAALGTSAAQMLANGYISVVLYRRYRIHPFTASYLKPVIFAVLVSTSIHYLFDLTPAASITEHITLLVIVGLVALAAPWVTRSVTAEDIALLASLESWLHKKTPLTDKLGAWVKGETRVQDDDRGDALTVANVLPNVVIAGVPKCGTTSLFEYLADHPQACPSNIKETRYLLDSDYPLYLADRNLNRGGLTGYADFFPDYRPRLHKICFEATPDYIYQKTALETLASLDPRPIIIFLLRKPSARVYSLYQFAKNNMATLDAKLTFGQFLTMLSEDAKYLHDRPLARNAIKHSRYSKYLAPWYQKFGRDHIHILLLEDLIADPSGIMKSLADALHIDSAFYDHYKFISKNESVMIRSHTLHKLVRRVGSSFSLVTIRGLGESVYRAYEFMNIRKGKPEMSPEDKELLKQIDDMFEDETVALTQLTGLDFKRWRG